MGLLVSLACGCLLRVVSQVEITVNGWLAVPLRDREASRRDRVNVLQHRAITRGEAEAHVVFDHGLVDPELAARVADQRRKRRRKEEPTSGPVGVVEGLLAGRVAGEDHALLTPVPHRDREHAVEAVEAIGAPLLVGAQHDLAIGPATERVPLGLELRTERAEVVDLSIEDRLHPAVRAAHGHSPGFGQIDDR